jgi:hypothetical protein
VGETLDAEMEKPDHRLSKSLEVLRLATGEDDIDGLRFEFGHPRLAGLHRYVKLGTGVMY